MNVRVPLAALLAGAFAAACGAAAPVPAIDLGVRIEAPAEVDFGRAFSVAVVRTRRRDLSPLPFDARALAPLVATPDGASRRDDGDRVEETLRFRCLAFEPEAVVLAGLPFDAVPAAGGEARRAKAPTVSIRVRPAVGAEAGTAFEPPGDAPPRSASLPLRGGLLALAGVLLLLARRRPSRVAPPPPPPPPPAPGPIAVAALDALAGTGAPPDERIPAIAQILRVHLARAFRIPAPERTTPEVCAALAGHAAVAPSAAAAYVEVLDAADRVKFQAAPADDALVRACDAAARAALGGRP